MNIANIIYLTVIIFLLYIMYSYISSYNEIVDELKRIRLKCVTNKNSQVKLEENIKKSNKNEEEEEEEEEEYNVKKINTR